MRFIEDALRQHQEEFSLGRYGFGPGSSTVLITPHFVTSRHVVALVFPAGSRQPCLVVKVPRRPGDNEGVRREAEMLRNLWTASRGLVPRTPYVVGFVDNDDLCLLVETALTGQPLDPLRVSRDLDGAMLAGADFVASLPVTRSAADNVDWYERKIGQPLRSLRQLVGENAEVALLVEKTHNLLLPLKTQEIPAVFEHGDLSHPNVFVRPDGKLQVADWERASPDGLPGHDYIFYLQYLSECMERAYTRPEQLLAFDRAFTRGGWARKSLAAHLVARTLDPDLIPLLLILTWARSAATLVDRLAAERAAGGEPKFILRALLEDRDFWLWRHVVVSSESLYPT